MMEHSTGALKEVVVQGFCYTIVLGCVMGGEMVLGALLEEFGEVMSSGFTTTVRVKGLDFGPVLSLCPSCEGLVSVESLVLGV